MPKLSHGAHVVVDYLSVALFAAAPSVLGFAGPDAVLCYALALAHLLVTGLTAGPGAAVRLIPPRVHGAVEIVVGVALLVGPWVTGTLFSATGRIFFTAVGAVLLVVRWLTDFGGETGRPEPGEPHTAGGPV